MSELLDLRWADRSAIGRRRCTDDNTQGWFGLGGYGFYGKGIGQ